VVQKAIEVAEPEQRRLMASELKDRVRELVEDQNGNHVIQKIIETMGKEKHHVAHHRGIQTGLFRTITTCLRLPRNTTHARVV